MPVFRVEKTKDYTVMSNYHLRDKSISLKAKGLLSQMLSLPPEWDYTLQGLAYINKEGINSVREGVKELENAGYIKRRRTRDAKGLFVGTEYVIREQPESDIPTYENRMLDNRTLENPTYDNETQINKEEEKKEKENIDCINHRIISYPGSENLPISDGTDRARILKAKTDFSIDWEVNRYSEAGDIVVFYCPTSSEQMAERLVRSSVTSGFSKIDKILQDELTFYRENKDGIVAVGVISETPSARSRQIEITDVIWLDEPITLSKLEEKIRVNRYARTTYVPADKWLEIRKEIKFKNPLMRI